MVRTRTKAKQGTRLSSSNGLKKPPLATTLSPEQLLERVHEHLAACDFEAAKAFCLRVLEARPGNASALELLGTAELELGEVEGAINHLTQATQPPPGQEASAAAYLYLAQLSEPEDALRFFKSAVDLLKARLDRLSSENGAVGAGVGSAVGSGSESESGAQEKRDEEGKELRRKISTALVGMTELYLTDLCFEPEAEQRCEEYLNLALSIDASDPEVYQTLASVRLSQERNEDAREVLQQAWSLWKDLEPGNVAIPPIPARLTFCRLLLETGQLNSALDVLNGIQQEDDQDVDLWYLLGWCYWLMGEEEAKKVGADAAESLEEGKGKQKAEEKEVAPTKEELWGDARECLETCQQLYQITEHEDPALLEHVAELVSSLDAAGIKNPEPDNEVGGDGEEDEWVDEEGEEEEDEAGDVDMG